jgi:hypothetical protein
MHKVSIAFTAPQDWRIAVENRRLHAPQLLTNRVKTA